MYQRMEEAVEALKVAWEAERDEARRRFQENHAALSWRERVERGVAAHDLSVDERDLTAGGALVLWLVSNDARFTAEQLVLRQGTPVRLFQPEAPEEAVRGVLTRWRSGRLGVIVDGDAGLEGLDAGAFRMEEAVHEKTFALGFEALGRLEQARGPLRRFFELAYGRRALEVGGGAPGLTFEDKALNVPQRAAIVHAQRCAPVALIHGPPGTGKTRVLVELVRQWVGDGLRVLVVAPSNAAVDHLVMGLAGAGLAPLRLGHVARVLPEAQPYALEVKVEGHEVAGLARKWMKESAALRQRALVAQARQSGTRVSRSEMFREARRLASDARQQLRNVERALVGDASVVCATLAGAAGLEGEFDRLVVDEATQALEPLLWAVLGHAERVVMAGDPMQLPPTVLGERGGGGLLSESLFERLVKRFGDDAVRQLVVQYRMHEEIMRFPSVSLYGGTLVAAPEVARARLEDVGIREDEVRAGARVWVDCAGAGFEEVRAENSLSLSNPAMAERTAKEVRRLVSRGVKVQDLGVISPYRGQLKVLASLLGDLVAEGLELASIDGFQGREKEAIVLDLVRSNPEGEIGFLEDTRRMNVALTRARRFLLVIGDSATLGGVPYYDGFLSDVEAYGVWLSVFSDDACAFE